MGLRTYRYRPPTTNRWGGATGAGVPTPSVTKRTNADTTTAAPATISAAPTIRSSTPTGPSPSGSGRACQPVMTHGRYPAKTPGARTRKTALPIAAPRLPNARSPPRSDRHPQSGRSRTEPVSPGGPQWFGHRPQVGEQLEQQRGQLLGDGGRRDDQAGRADAYL